MFRVQLLEALGTNVVTEIRTGMIADIDLKGVPPFGC
jgi:hypothetical protein